MKITVLGSGLIGLCSAYFLQKSGHEVTVVDRENEVAMETSFANGGQISVGYSEPWANFSNLIKMKDWIGKPDSPILMHPKSFLENPKWFLNFLYQCFPENNQKNIKDMLKISAFSRDVLKTIRDEHNINYEQQINGIITYYTTEKSFSSSIETNRIFNQNGCNRSTKSYEELLFIEPSLKHASFKIFGGDFLEDDESGNARLFCLELYKICLNLGVKFIFNHSIIADSTLVHNSKLTSIYIKNLKNPSANYEKMHSDIFICCLGSYSNDFINSLNINEKFLLYPVKGYSASIPIKNLDKVNFVSLTDSDKKIVFTRLGNTLRAAGTAEFIGYNTDIDEKRCTPLIKRAEELFGDSIDSNNVTYWTGLRPTTPHGSPYIKQSNLHNLFLNFGHGTLGWTMAAGSGKLISQIINKDKLFTI